MTLSGLTNLNQRADAHHLLCAGTTCLRRLYDSLCFTSHSSPTSNMVVFSHKWIIEETGETQCMQQGGELKFRPNPTLCCAVPCGERRAYAHQTYTILWWRCNWCHMWLRSLPIMATFAPRGKGPRSAVSLYTSDSTV